MLKKPNKAALRSLFALTKHLAWRDLTSMLDEELQATYDLLTESRDPAILHQMQGRAQFIRDFQKAARDVRSNLEKLGDSTL